MWAYLKRHLRGDLSLPTAFWLNGAAFFAFLALAVAGLARAFAGFDDVPRIIASLGRDGTAAALAVLSLTGIWNAATRAAAAGGRAGPAGAKLAVLLAAIGILHYLSTTVPGRVVVLSVRLDPGLADYTIARTTPDEVTFAGALNDTAVREIAAELARPGVRVLRITSHGGLIIPVMGLADVIARRKIAVMAIGRCLSSCTLLLAASPNAIVAPGTRIAFHRPTPAVVANGDSAAIALASAAWHARYREYGIDAGAVAEMARREVWAPGLAALAEMGMIRYVLDGRPPRLVPARTWCRDNAAACAP